MIVGRDGPVLTLDTSALLGGGLRLTDPRDVLRAQDRRRLHRLGLRPEQGTAERSWTWEPALPGLPAGAPPGELLPVRLRSWAAREDACRSQLLAVVRDGLRLEPSQLTLLPVDDEEPDDDAWDEAWGDVW